MHGRNNTIDKAELRQLSEMLAVFQKLPLIERTALQYYIKGRADAINANVEIPINFPAEEPNTATAATL